MKFLGCKKLIIVCVTVLLIAGCVKHQEFVQPPTRIPEFYDNKETKAGLTVIADPYLSEGKVIQAFGYDVTEEGIYPIHLILSNNSALSFDFSEAEVYLLGEDGTRILPMDASSAIKKMRLSSTTRVVGYAFLGGISLVVTTGVGTGIDVDPFLDSSNTPTSGAGGIWHKKLVKPEDKDDGFLFFSFGRSKKDLRGFGTQRFSFCLNNVRVNERDEIINFKILIKETLEKDFQPSMW